MSNAILAFGYGAHQCIGQHLARLEMVTALNAVVERISGLRLAPPLAETKWCNLEFIYGVEELPMMWDDIAAREGQLG